MLFSLLMVVCGEEAKKKAVQEDETKNESAITLGENFTVPDLNLDMIWVKPGTFKMGSPVNASEIQHQVTLTKGFYLGKYEVTQAQWKQVMGDNPSVFKGADRPVEKVSWSDAVDFCDKLTEMENKAGRVPQAMFYRLPTESQWEYACRAGTSTKYSWGDDIDPKLANYRDNGLKETVPVGSYRPNAWGFYDMPGNVWEWTADWGGIYPSGPVTDPIGPASGHHGADSSRVIRGGSWGSPNIRSAGRSTSHPRNSFPSLGFRVSFQTSESVEKFSGQSNANLSKNIEIKAQHIIENKVDIVLTNLKAGANPNIVFNKNTALHFACSLGKFEIVELLLKFGAKPNPSNGRYTPMDLLFNKDWKGKTAEEKMSSKVREKILNLLKKNGGKQMQDIQLSKFNNPKKEKKNTERKSFSDKKPDLEFLSIKRSDLQDSETVSKIIQKASSLWETFNEKKTGWAVLIYPDTNQVGELSQRKNGIYHGLQAEWYPDGTMRTLREWKNGKLHGLHEMWWGNGIKHSEGNYTNGERSGTWVGEELDGYKWKIKN